MSFLYSRLLASLSYSVGGARGYAAIYANSAPSSPSSASRAARHYGSTSPFELGV